MKRTVVNTRSAAAWRVTHPRSIPTGYAVSANPIAATLEKLFVGQRSGVSPLLALVLSQNHEKVRCSSVSRNAILAGGITPATGDASGCVAVAHPCWAASAKTTTKYRVLRIGLAPA